MADNSVRRRTGLARQFFLHVVKRKLIAENPFDGLAAAVRGNVKRQQFVPVETIYSALKHTTCPQLRAVIALSRFGGLRTPSETLELTWQDVDLTSRRLTVHAPKTEHFEDGGLRFCPIFDELYPYLLELQDIAKPGIDCPMSSPVFTRWNSADQNLRTPLLNVLRRAGIKAWPKLYQNLRATRQTELLAQFPAKDVCDWLENSEAVAMKHYAMPTDDIFPAGDLWFYLCKSEGIRRERLKRKNPGKQCFRGFRTGNDTLSSRVSRTRTCNQRIMSSLL